MAPNEPQLAQGRPYCSFMTLVFSLAGWVLLEAWAIIMGASLYGHIVNAIPGLILTILSLPRSPVGSPGPAAEHKGPPEGSRWAPVLPVLFLFLLGAVLGVLIVMGELLLLGLLTACLGFAPWWRLAFSRQHFALSCSITLAGLICPIVVDYHALNTMYLPLACWVFWLCACCALLACAEKRRRVARKAKAGRGGGEAKPDSATVHT